MSFEDLTVVETKLSKMIAEVEAMFKDGGLPTEARIALNDALIGLLKADLEISKKKRTG